MALWVRHRYVTFIVITRSKALARREVTSSIEGLAGRFFWTTRLGCGGPLEQQTVARSSIRRVGQITQRGISVARAFRDESRRVNHGLRNSLLAMPAFTRGARLARELKNPPMNIGPPDIGSDVDNPLVQYFADNRYRRGLWKWEHYFDAYHRHLDRFRGRDVYLLEIGIYSGGSIDMWRWYMGDRCTYYGVDFDPSCSAYASDQVSVLIGDQADRSFWGRVRESVPKLDVVIDDGGHRPEQQMVTLEEMLPHLNPGGVYVCEDAHGLRQPVIEFASGLVDELNRCTTSPPDGFTVLPDQPFRLPASSYQRRVHSIHFYPFMLVIETRVEAGSDFVSRKQGSIWNPHFDY